MCQWDFKKNGPHKKKAKQQNCQVESELQKIVVGTKKNNIFLRISHIYVISTCGVLLFLGKQSNANLTNVQNSSHFSKTIATAKVQYTLDMPHKF